MCKSVYDMTTYIMIAVCTTVCQLRTSFVWFSLLRVVSKVYGKGTCIKVCNRYGYKKFEAVPYCLYGTRVLRLS